ncbi:MAG: hypothetical protein QXH62_06040 [Candidatus Bathyarchaeia archaeon]
MKHSKHFKKPKIIIAWPYSEDNVKFAKALMELGIIDDYELSKEQHEVYLISYRNRVTITLSDEERMFNTALGFIPKEFIKDAWFDSYIDIRQGRIVKYTKEEVIVESSEKQR